MSPFWPDGQVSYLLGHFPSDLLGCILHQCDAPTVIAFVQHYMCERRIIQVDDLASIRNNQLRDIGEAVTVDQGCCSTRISRTFRLLLSPASF